MLTKRKMLEAHSVTVVSMINLRGVKNLLLNMYINIHIA